MSIPRHLTLRVAYVFRKISPPPTSTKIGSGCAHTEILAQLHLYLTKTEISLYYYKPVRCRLVWVCQNTVWGWYGTNLKGHRSRQCCSLKLWAVQHTIPKTEPTAIISDHFDSTCISFVIGTPSALTEAAVPRVVWLPIRNSWFSRNIIADLLSTEI